MASLLLAALVLTSSSCNRSSGRPEFLVVNEAVSNISFANPAQHAVLTAPDGTALVDADGEPVDWVEIYNPSDRAVGLSNFTLSDDIGEPDQYRFPPGSVIEPRGFVIVICDGEPERGAFHAPFRLRSEGETVYLFADEGERLVDRKGFRDSFADISVGRFPDGGESEYGFIYRPTPAGPNRPVGTQLPRFQGSPGLAPAGPGPEDPIFITVELLEDRELLAAALTVQDLGACGDENAEPGDPFTVDDFTLDVLGEIEEERRNFRGDLVTVPVQRLALTFSIPFFPNGTLLGLTLRAENVIGETIKEERQVVGGSTVTVAINEYQPRNQSTLIFEEVINVDGENVGPLTPDWLELYNYGTEPIDLTGYSLIGRGTFEELTGGNARPVCPPDTPGACRGDSPCLYLWTFDQVPADPVLQPGERRIILADNDCPPFFKEYRQTPGQGPTLYSADFQISGETFDIVVLRDPCGVVVDQAEFDFSTEPLGSVAPDLSFGRFPDGAGADPAVPIECDLSEGDPVGNDARIFLTPGCRFNCPTPGESNLLACDIAPEFDSIVRVDPRCPEPDEEAVVSAFLSVDQDTLAMDQAGSPTFEVEMNVVVRAPDGGEEGFTLTRDDGLSLQPLGDFELVCLRPRPVNGATTLVVTATLPPQEEGTLVTFSYRARDLFLPSIDPALGEWVEHREEDHPTSSFRYVSGFTPPAVRINEVLPQNDTLFIDLYPPAVRDLPEFTPPDFAELYNSSTEPLDVSGMYLTDSADDSQCPRGLIREVRKFRIPDGTVIPPKGFLLLLFVDEVNAEPQLPAELAGRTVFVDTMNLANCRETLYLIAADEGGHCVVDEICWNCLGGGGEGDPCIAPVPDRSFGWLPDRDPNFQVPPRLRVLDVPTPGASNCVYEPVELVGSVIHSIVGAAEPMGCVNPGSTVVIEGNAFVNARQWLLSPGTHGLETAEIILDRDGVQDVQPLTVIRQLQAPAPLPSPEICQALLKFSIVVPPPQPDLVLYTIRLIDIEGTVLEAGPFSYGSQSASPAISINEAQAVNLTTIEDPQGQNSPWIELFNGTGGTFDLGGMYLTDDLRQPRKWQVPAIPATSLPAGPGGFLVIFLNGETENDDDLQSSLNLPAATPGELFLLDRVDRGQCVVDRFAYDFSTVLDDLSLGRLPDGQGAPRNLECATPGRTNSDCDGTESDFIRGDANFDLRVNISDMAWIFRVLFLDPPPPVSCFDAFDSNDDGEIDLDDGLYIGNYLFLNGPVYPPPFPMAGADPTPDSLTCLRE